jgi:hypothetical protein
LLIIHSEIRYNGTIRSIYIEGKLIVRYDNSFQTSIPIYQDFTYDPLYPVYRISLYIWFIVKFIMMRRYSIQHNITYINALTRLIFRYVVKQFEIT